MQTYSALLIGASGLVGSHLLNILLDHPQIHKVTILVRKPIGNNHPKLEEKIIDFNDLVQFEKAMGTGDFIFSCIGTTMKKVNNDKKLYRQIDFDIPVNAARFGVKVGYSKFLIVSAHLANPKSRIFYSRLKGETDEIVSTFPFQAIHIFQPSFLIGARKEKRWLELSFGKLMERIASILPGNYKPVKAEIVAKSMLSAALNNQKGTQIYHYKEMNQLIR
jgi:uncharacterized protein YbjT (DUF2867 family)